MDKMIRDLLNTSRILSKLLRNSLDFDPTWRYLREMQGLVSEYFIPELAQINGIFRDKNHLNKSRILSKLPGSSLDLDPLWSYLGEMQGLIWEHFIHELAQR